MSNNLPAKNGERSKSSVKIFGLFALLLFLAPFAYGQTEDADEDYIVPVRPSVSESANIQKKGVLQIETGADFDFDAPDYRNQQTNSLGVYFAAAKNLRLDFELETVASQKDHSLRRETGIGDVNLGFKAIARDEPKKRLAVAFSYSIKLPTAAEDKGLGTGKVDHNLRVIFDRTVGKNDFTANFSYLNVGREMSGKRDSGAQIILRYDRRLTKRLELINEFYGNTVDEEQPRGIYYNGALTYRINKHLQFDVGARPGFGRDAPRIGIYAGLTVGVANLLSRK